MNTGAGFAPAANGAVQSAPECGALSRQREYADRTGRREGRREIQNGHVVEYYARVEARVHQHVVCLHAKKKSGVGISKGQHCAFMCRQLHISNRAGIRCASASSRKSC